MNQRNLELRNASDSNRLVLRKSIGPWSAGTLVKLANVNPLMVNREMGMPQFEVAYEDLVIRRSHVRYV